MIKKISNTMLMLLIVTSAFTQKEPVRIGFIGNSITIGANYTVADAYPSQLDKLLKAHGDTCDIQNYAVSGRTLLKHGDVPIWNETSFKSCIQSAPNIVYIMLGTNDTKPQNWDTYSNEFIKDYKAMIDTFRYRNPRTRFILAYPPPAYAYGPNVWNIRDSIITRYILPAVDSMVKYANAELVDYNHPLKDSVSLFPDKIHPNPTGHKVMAKILYNKIISSDILNKVEKGYTYLTSVKSSSSTDLPSGDTAKLSWTTINANEIFLNGVKVDNTGSVKVAPKTTTKYTLVAKGNKNSDSLIIEQKVYIQTLTKISFSLSNSVCAPGDVVKIKINYYDQLNYLIKNTSFDATWKIEEGYGKIQNNNKDKVEFIADSIGLVTLNCNINGVSGKVKITVQSATSINSLKIADKVMVYPNPVNKVAYFNLVTTQACNVTIKIYDMNGRLCLKELKTLHSAGKQQIELNMSRLLKGNYTYEIEGISGKLNGKFIKE
jgi:lysophospholipase L1-like esterase